MLSSLQVCPRWDLTRAVWLAVKDEADIAERCELQDSIWTDSWCHFQEGEHGLASRVHGSVFPSLTGLEVTRFGLGDTSRRAVRSRSASQSCASTPISQNLFAPSFLIPECIKPEMRSSRNSQPNEIKWKKETHASLLILPQCNTPRRFWIYSLTAKQTLACPSSDWDYVLNWTWWETILDTAE